VVKFNQIKGLFKSLKPQKQTSLDAFFAHIPDIEKLISNVSQNSTAETFFDSPSDITIDNDWP
jgi:hypothetical protein